MQPEWQAHLDELMQQYKSKRAQLKDVQERMTRIEASYTTDDELITVRVGPQGRLLDLKLDPRISRRLSSQELAEAIVAAVNAAADQAQAQMRSAMGSMGSPGGFDVSKVLPERVDDLESIKEFYGFRDRE